MWACYAVLACAVRVCTVRVCTVPANNAPCSTLCLLHVAVL